MVDQRALFDAMEAALMRGSATLSLRNGWIWVDDAAFDPDIMLAELTKAQQTPADGLPWHQQPVPETGLERAINSLAGAVRQLALSAVPGSPLEGEDRRS